MQVAQPRTGRADALVVRGVTSPSEEMADFIASISKPIEVDLARYSTAPIAIRAVCGYMSEVLLARVKAENPDSKKTGKLRIPGCVYARQDTPVKTTDHDDLKTLLRREMGVVPEFKLPCAAGVKLPRCGRTVQSLVGELNPGLDLDHLPPNFNVVIPYQTHLQTIELKDSVDARTVLDQLWSVSQQTLIARIAVEPSLVAPLSAENVTKPSCKAAATLAGPSWPFDVATLTEVLNRNITAHIKHGKAVKPAVVAVLDTGLVGRDEFFPEAYFAKNTKERESGPVRDNDRNGYKNDVIGVNALLQGNVKADTDYEFRDHGSAVANLVLGGGTFRASFRSVEKLVKLKIVKVVQKVEGQYTIPEAAVIEGMKYAYRSNAMIANVSVGTKRKISEVLAYARTPPGLVTIVAAGNTPKRLDDRPAYPANFGGTLGDGRDNIITVVALDGANQPAEFSSFGSHFADIAAPGCDLTFREKSDRLYGTSFAAPLVTFSVALMRSFGFGQNERSDLIKQRLQASADYDPNLSKTVAFSGRLNIPKAVSLYEDVVELKVKDDAGRATSRLAFGSWQVQSEEIALCKGREPVIPHVVKKITPLDNGDIRVLVRTMAGNLDLFECSPSSAGLDFIEGASAKRQIAWSEIADFVPSYFGH
ncbi:MULTISPECIES: S8 family serine peptidase [unclassified Bradyrhizobium]|uniref:S8 family serine peptidase n=1 Tax=unclassified Bradyrhizobium TaxID=2631580 RepID=UPI0028EFAB2B|nr:MULTISPECIES: S8 family serine peptidase [unclassified Bradyrhizobium]